MRNNHLGYINQRFGSDVESFEVFTENGKTLAVEVKKIPAVMPSFTAGGFAGHCDNQDAVWSGSETQEVGAPFEVKRFSNGLWGYTAEDWNLTGIFDENTMKTKFPAWEAAVKADGYEVFVRKQEGATSYEALTVKLTKTGKRKTIRVTLGKLSDHCAYYYDYNF
jgi:hypothetical protein